MRERFVGDSPGPELYAPRGAAHDEESPPTQKDDEDPTDERDQGEDQRCQEYPRAQFAREERTYFAEHLEEGAYAREYEQASEECVREIEPIDEAHETHVSEEDLLQVEVEDLLSKMDHPPIGGDEAFSVSAESREEPDVERLPVEGYEHALVFPEDQARRMCARQPQGLEFDGSLLDEDSRRFLLDAAERASVRPEELVCDWMLYEAALDYGIVHQIWRERGNAKDPATRELVASFLDGLAAPPSMESGIRVLAQSERRILVSLYGAAVVEEVEGAHAGPCADAVRVSWKSNYEYLRAIYEGEAPEEWISEEIRRRGSSFGISYAKQFEEFLTKSGRQPWATLVADENPLSLAKFLKEQDVLQRAEAGFREGARGGRPGTLRDLFPRLAPAVPIVEAVGRGFGSGFLVEDGNNLYVVTNRHVVEGASQGFSLRFWPGERPAREPFQARLAADSVVRVHRAVDLALLAVDGRTKSELRKNGVRALALADRSFQPGAGDYVFVIGHPGSPGGTEVLSWTLTDGIVSGVRSIEGFGPCIQVTVAINPGNSGGPLFDVQGRVIGIVTFSMRKGDRGLALEALNFACSVTSLWDLLRDPTRSLGRAEIAELLRAPPEAALESAPPEVRASVATLTGIVEHLSERGFRPLRGDLGRDLHVFYLSARDSKRIDIDLERGREYALVAVTDAPNDVDLAVFSLSGEILGVDVDPAAIAVVFVRTFSSGRHEILVTNASGGGTGFVILAALIR